MFDPYIRPYIHYILNPIGKYLSKHHISANTLTILGFFSGLLAMFCISQQQYSIALAWLIANRLFDGLDGAVARQHPLHDFGGFLDIVCDFIIYAGIIFAFALANPSHALAASFLIFSFIGPITSFLAYAILAAKQHKTTNRCGRKSFFN